MYLRALCEHSRMEAMTKDLKQLFQEFMYECEYVAKLRPRTILGYKKAFETFVKYTPGLALEALTSQMIIKFFKTLNERNRIVGKGVIKNGIRNSTAGAYWCKLNAFCKWLETNRCIATNPFAKLKFPKISYDEIKFIKKEEVERILAATYNCNYNSPFLLERNLSIIYLLLFSGIRREELLSLQIRDLNMNKKTIVIRAETSKSGRTRILPLHPTVVLHLKTYLVIRKKIASQFLFVSSQTKERLSTDGFKHFIGNLNNHSGVRFHTHQFRHTFAVNFLKSNNNIHTLMYLLGHTDVRVTIQYLRYVPNDELKGNIAKLTVDGLI